ncbi:MAG: NUDIX domain-containing protein [Mariprofundaceae bacterium]|nr:NUDIX domain-containing protein [Mariprofundaceae bacterium]
MKKLTYKILKKEPLSRGFFKLDAYTLEHDCFEAGSLSIRREHLEKGKAVAVLLYDKNLDEVLLIEQFRIGPAVRGDEAWLIEVVAGMVDEGEDLITAARRESIEETGYSPYDLTHLGQYYATPGGSSETIDLYLGLVNQGEAVGQGGGVASEHEDIRSFWLTRAKAMLWLQQGKINSGAPMLALLLAFGSAGII